MDYHKILFSAKISSDKSKPYADYATFKKLQLQTKDEKKFLLQ